VPLPADNELFRQPNVWSEPDRYGLQSSLFLSDPELKVIQDLGVTGRNRVMTEEIICAVKALEIVVVLNSSSAEGVVHSNVAAKERDNVVAKAKKLENELVY